MVHYGLIDTIPRTKTKILQLQKISLLFFRAVYHSKKHVIPYPGIDAILDVNNNMPVKFHIYNWKLSENSY